MNAGLTRLDMLQDKEESIIATNKLDHCSHDSDDGPSNHPRSISLDRESRQLPKIHSPHLDQGIEMIKETYFTPGTITEKA